MQPEPQVEDTFGVVTAEEAAKKDEPQDLLPLPHEMLEAAEEQIQRVETRLERYNQLLTVYTDNENACYICQETLTGTDMERFRLCGTLGLELVTQRQGCNGLLCTRCTPDVLVRYGSTCPYCRTEDCFPGLRDDLQAAAAPAPAEPAPAPAQDSDADLIAEQRVRNLREAMPDASDARIYAMLAALYQSDQEIQDLRARNQQRTEAMAREREQAIQLIQQQPAEVQAQLMAQIDAIDREQPAPPQPRGLFLAHIQMTGGK